MFPAAPLLSPRFRTNFTGKGYQRLFRKVNGCSRAAKKGGTAQNKKRSRETAALFSSSRAFWTAPDPGWLVGVRRPERVRSHIGESGPGVRRDERQGVHR